MLLIFDNYNVDMKSNVKNFDHIFSSLYDSENVQIIIITKVL